MCECVCVCKCILVCEQVYAGCTICLRRIKQSSILNHTVIGCGDLK